MGVCDKELVGKTLKHDGMEIVVSEQFYKDKEITENELKEKLKSIENINLIGNKAVGVAIQEKLVDEKSVIDLNGIKHASIFTV